MTPKFTNTLACHSSGKGRSMKGVFFNPVIMGFLVAVVVLDLLIVLAPLTLAEGEVGG